MKICQINNLYKPYSRGGTDRIVEIINNGLAGLGHSVFVISTQADKKSFVENGNYYLKSFYNKLSGFNVIVRTYFVLLDIFCTKNYFRIKRILKKERPDLVITHNLRGLGFMSVLALRKFKHVHVLHDIQLIHPSGLMLWGGEDKLKSLFTKLYYYFTKKIIGSPKFVISPSSWLLNEHIQKGFFKKSQTMVMPNPTEISERINARQKENDGIKFLYVGEIEKHKGVFLLIEAFEKCQKYFENISLDIIGKGSCQADIPHAQGISYLGWKSKTEVAEAMANSDCLVLPSLCYENSPTVIYEAAAQSLPVIASRIGGVGELTHLFGGINFNAGDCLDLERKLVYAIKNPQIMKNMGEESRRIIPKYSVENYLKNFIEKILA